MLGALFALLSQARDFTYTYQGQTLTYTVLDEDAKNCSTLASNGFSHSNKISGDLVIPPVAKDGDTEYTVTTIGKLSFNGCTDMTSVIIPNTVTTINDEAFYGCKSLSTITIPNSVTAIGEGCFIKCEGLKSVTLSDLLTEIPYWTFQGCESLTNVLLPESLKIIGQSAFERCAALNSLTIPESVTTIAQTAFAMSGLTSLNIPASVSTIGSEAFVMCRDLMNINVDPANVNYTSEDGIVYSKDKTEIIAVPGGKESVNIPSTITSIPPAAFIGCMLSSVIIPNSVTVIGRSAFGSCEKLTSVDIPTSVTEIGDYAFVRSGLTSVNIPASVRSIGTAAFGTCYDLTEIYVEPDNQVYAGSDGSLYTIDYTRLLQVPAAKSGNFIIPRSVSIIYEEAFSRCYKITSVEIPNTVTVIGKYAFQECTGLESIEIPNSVECIDDYAFAYTNLTSVKIPDSVISLGDAFWSCSELTSVSLGSNLASIGAMAFNSCRKISDIHSYAKVPPTCAGDGAPFNYSVFENAVLHVPEGSVNAYKSADMWKNFSHIVGDISGIEDVTVDSLNAAPVEVYNLRGVKIGNSNDALAPGIYIVRQGTVTKKIAVQ